MNAMQSKSPSMSLRPSAAGGDAYDLMVHGDIGDSFFGESVSAKDVVTQLRGLPASVKALNIRVNSFGGSVADGLAIYNAIRAFPGTRTTHVDGVAISAGSLIAMAGDEVVAPETALIMIHGPWTVAQGNAIEMRKHADLLDKWAETMISAYTRKTGKDESEVRTLLTDGEDHWYTASEAKAEGFVDRILGEEDLSAAAKASLAAAPSAIRQLAMASFRGAVPAFAQEKTLMSKPTEVQTPEAAVTDPIVAAAASPEAKVESPEAKVDDVQARVDAAIAAARLEIEAAAQAKVEAAQAEVAQVQSRLTAEIEAKEISAAISDVSARFGNLPACKADSLGPALRTIRAKAPEAAAMIESVLAAANALLADGVTSQTVAIGDAGSASAPTAKEQVAQLAKAKMESNPAMSIEQARSMVYNERTDLFAAVRSEED